MPITINVLANLDGTSQLYAVQGWNDGGTTVVLNGKTLFLAKGSASIDGWKRTSADQFFAADVDNDGKQEIIIYNNNDGWLGVFKWTNTLHCIWGSPSPIKGPAGQWNRRGADWFGATIVDGKVAIAATGPDGWHGIFEWQGNALAPVVIQQGAINTGWPMKFSQKDHLDGVGIDVTTSVILYQDGRMNLLTATHEETKLRGGHAGVLITLYDKDGNFIWAGKPPQRFGVDGSWIGASDRSDSYSYTVDSDSMGIAHQICIKQYSSPNDAWDDIQPWLNGAGKLASTAGPIVQLIKAL